MVLRRCVRRWFRPGLEGAGGLGHLASAIRGLLRAGESTDPWLLGQGLRLLHQHLGADRTSLVMVESGGLDTRWWHPERLGEAAPAPPEEPCQWLLAHPERILAQPDARGGRRRGGPGALLGCVLRQGDGVRAILLASFQAPRPLRRTEVAILESVALFLGQALEVEDLKRSVQGLEDALAITQAVVEDSSIRDAETDLPNRRYLEVWEHALLASGHAPPSLVVAEFQMAVTSRKDAAWIRKAMVGIRAGDLVVRLGPDRFRVVFRHTSQPLAHILLLRLRTRLGGVPMGATVWEPGPGGGLESCSPRLERALARSRSGSPPGLVWLLPEAVPQGGRTGEVRTRRAAPLAHPWRPPTLKGA